MSEAQELQQRIENHRALPPKNIGNESFDVANAKATTAVAEILAASSQLAEISTRRIIRLTWFLALLTLGLVGLTTGLLIHVYPCKASIDYQQHHQY